MEVCGQHASLGCVCWRHEEVKHIACIIRPVIFDQSLVDYAARWRIVKTTLVILNKEPLSDALVDNNDSNLRFGSSLVVQLVDSALKLRDFSRQHLVALCITYTITINDEVGWELILVVLGEHSDGFFQSFLHVLLDNL